MIVRVLYRAIIGYSSYTTAWDFNSLLEMKEFLSHVDTWSGLTLTLKKVTYTLNTTTHVISETIADVKSW